MPDDRGDFNIAHVAALARLALSPDDAALYQTQLAGILGYAAEVLAVPTDGVPPMTGIPLDAADGRADAVEPSLPLQAVLDRAPDPDAATALLRVPKVLG